ncbi:hypothetical protein PMAYCL1PPCAC_09882 [Pristionchus mayeri]|uniref:Uncharacterized protein n=1 Tax=Pristionchus mayeri TaxID=1317129 RepID=A0AAN4ZK88_9BILA|nr:hypothetical protein PMAYCL1PPCAC_09882 [Pristionchus mayeri]
MYSSPGYNSDNQFVCFINIEKNKPLRKSCSDSRKKKKSKIRDEINGTRKPNNPKNVKLQNDDDNNSHEKGGKAKTPGLETKEESRKRDESDDVILNMLKENKEKEHRSGKYRIAYPLHSNQPCSHSY